jgi:hypothetical protein
MQAAVPIVAVNIMFAELPPSTRIFETAHPSIFASITIASMCG